MDSDNNQININNIGSLELTDETTTVSASDYNILKLKDGELWYSFENGGDTHEFRLSLLIGRQTKSIKQILLRPLIFALVQGLLVLIGYFFGLEILKYIFHFDHWLIFGSFTFLATKQFFENSEPQIKVRNIWLQSLLTSLEGLLIGFTLSIENHSVSCVLIRSLVITYLLSLIGVTLG